MTNATPTPIADIATATRAEPAISAEILQQHAWFRLEDQLAWFDRKSVHCQRWYKRLKLAQICLAVLVTVTSLIPDPYAKWVAALSGALIAILEAVQELNQYSTLWVSYRGTAEKLRLERSLFLSEVGPYRDAGDLQTRVRLLAERVEEHLATENTGWLSSTGKSVEALTKKEDKDAGDPA